MKAKINRKDILANLVEIPEKADAKFWQKEMAILKRLERKFSIDFLAQLVPEKKVPTIAFYFAEWKQKLLEIEFKEFYYTHLHKTDLADAEKIGKDYKVKPKQTIKGFLS